MLAGDDDSIHADGLAVFVVLHGDLTLAIRAQIVHLAALTHGGQALGQLVCQRNGHGHQLRGLVTGITEHHALIARTADLVVGAEGDIGALAVDVGDDGAGVSVKAVLCAGVADIGDDLADDLLEIDVAAGGDLAHDVHQTRGSTGLASHAGVGVVGQDLVQNGIGDLVADLVGMSFGDGLGSKQMSCHKIVLQKCVVILSQLHTRHQDFAQTKTPRTEVLSVALLSFGFPQDLAPYASAQVVGLRRACPLSHS